MPRPEQWKQRLQDTIDSINPSMVIVDPKGDGSAWVIDDEAFETLTDAARRVLEGEPVWWCKTHYAQGIEFCWRAAYAGEDKLRCRMVERTLINQGDE